MTDYSGYQYLKVEKKDKVALVTLNRPERLNAIVVPEMHDEIEHVFGDISSDQEVNVMVLTGAGNAFCAGADVSGQKTRATTLTPQQRIAEWMHGPGRVRLLNAILDVRQPTISAVNGAAVGLGATLALFCDLIIASDRARFGDTHIRVGLVPGDGGTIIWPLLCGLPRAKEFLWTGDLISAAEADRMGMVNHVVPHEELMPRTMELAARLANGPTIAIQLTKRACNKRLREQLNLVGDLSDAVQVVTYFTEDSKEGPQAFLEKRPPRFSGK